MLLKKRERAGTLFTEVRLKEAYFYLGGIQVTEGFK